MANYQNILRQAHQAIADVADNADSWRAFLRSAAYTTHYAFPNQALIYSQRPGATMLADIDTWNRAAGRWVNRGAHGVASLGTGNMAGNVRYLFDIKDTHPAGKASKPLGWQITDANRYPTLQALQEKHSAESLPEIFGLQAALFVAQYGKQLDADLQNAVIGSTLEWAKPQEQTAIFANLITQSAVYMAAVRCGLGDSAVPQDAFADIDRFDTESAVLALGNAVNRAGRQMFAEIGAVVKSIDSVAKTQPKQYDVNVSKTNQQEVQDHGYDESERVSGAQDGNDGNTQTAGRKNRSAAGEVPAREPLPAVRQDAAGRDTVQRPETDRAALLGAGGADHHEAAGQQPGTGQEQRPVGLDGAHEQSASAGGGTGDAHRDEPVNTEPTTAESEPSPSAVSVSDVQELPESVGRGDLAEETAAAIGLPSLEQQQETIRQLQPRASWQPPIKDDGTHIDEQDIVDVLVIGSGFCEGRFRIQEFFSATVLPTVKEQADWLKKEYGIGGRTWDFRDGERGFLDYDAKGLRIKRYASDNDPDYFRLLPWNEVARRLHLLVHNDQYLDENNKQGYEKWEAEQQAKRDARQAEIDYAEKTIADFCEREGLGEPDFSNLTHIDLAYSTTGDGEHEIQVYANFLRNEIVYLVDGSFVDSARFDNTRALANSMAELYTMQRYLQRETLEQHGLSSFDAWASTFGETVTAVELAPEGTGYRTKTRFSKFYNLPELMSMFKQVADVQTADMLNLPVPKLVGGKPINVALPPSPQQKQMVADLADRAEEIRAGNVDPTEDNMLKVTNDGRKLALDQRLIDPNLPENPNDKVHACAENVYRIWSETKDKRLTQLVFCDLSTPKPDGFNVYDDLRNLLISMGIPENEVQFIHSANTEVKKAELFAKVRSGDVRVLMGSTGKMGAGTNVQRLLVATHHLDCGWKPSDIEQRNGRMIRQGNTNAEVYEYRYVTESSFDSYMWQLLETKQKFIGQVMTSKSPARSADDLDDAALSYAEVKALAAGNPMIKEKMDLDIQVARLKTLKTAYNNEHYRLEDAITQGFPAEMRKTAQQLENAKADTALLQQNTKRDADGKDVFAISLMDTVYTKREDAGKALLGLLGMAMNRTEPVSIGRYKGFDLQIAYFAMDKMYLAYLVGSGINPVQLGADAVGNTMRLDNCLHNLPQSVTDLESKLVQLQKQLENAKEQLAQPFAQADELAEKSKHLAELEALLNLNEKDIVLDTVPDEEQQCRSDNRQRGQER